MTISRSDSVNPESPRFERGDLVRWPTQGRGQHASAVGVVVLAVPPGVPIDTLLAGLRARYSMRAMRNASGNRPGWSYLIARTDRGKRGRARIHWPHAATVRPYAGGSDESTET